MHDNAVRTHYERAILRDARAVLKNPYRTPVSAVAHVAQKGGDVPRIDEATAAAIEIASGGIMALSDVTARTLAPAAVCAAYRREGYGGIQAISDIASLELWEADEVVDRLRPRYLLLGAAGGAVVARLGAAALSFDVPVLGACALRAIQDSALHYGFALDDEEERAFAIRILIAAVVPGVSVERATFDDLGRVAGALTRAWKRYMRRSWFLPVALHVLRRLLRRDARAMLLKRVVSIGVAAANAWFMSGVLDIAQAAYRRRFLARAENARNAALAAKASDQPPPARVVVLRRG
jgi:hypothetical protein